MKKNIFAAVAVFVATMNAGQVDPSVFNYVAAVVCITVAAWCLVSGQKPAAE